MTPERFKRSIRNLQVWCSSCMVAFSGGDPIGVLIGAKRASGTLIHRIAVHPEHVRQGHARHLLDSLGSKLAILGPPRIVAEVPEALGPAGSLFTACGYAQEAVLTDYELIGGPSTREASPRSLPSTRDESPRSLPSTRDESPRSLRAGHAGGFVIPITVDDLAANGLLEDARPQICWERSVETLTARKEEIAGLAVASDERIEAYLLYMANGEIVALRSLIDDGEAGLAQLLSRLGPGTCRLPKVHPDEISKNSLETLGFHPTAAFRVYSTKAGT
jgi:hypothetical protein